MGTTATTDFCGITVELGLGVGALTAASSWTDVTTYVRGMTPHSASRNRDTDLFNGGSLSITFANRDRRFDPSYAAGPYFGNLKPRVQIRIKAVWSAVTYPIWYGYIDRWPQSLPQQMFDAEVVVTASDGFKILNAPMPPSVWWITVDALADAETFWYPLAEEFGTVMGDASGNGAHGTYEAGATFNHRTSLLPYGAGGSIEFNGGEQCGLTPPVVATFAADVTVGFWAQMPDPVPTGGATDPHYTPIRSDLALGNDGAGQMWMFYLDPADDSAFGGTHPPGCMVYANWLAQLGTKNPRWSDRAMVSGRVYFVAVTFDAATTTAKLFIDGVEQGDDGPGFGSISQSQKGTLQIAGRNTAFHEAWPARLGEVVIFGDQIFAPATIASLYAAGAAPWDDDTSGGRVTHVADAMAWPASLRDIDTGTSLFGPATLEGTALEYLQLCARSEAGHLYMAPDGDLTFVGRANLKTEARFITSAGTFSDRSGTLLYENIVTSGWDEQSIINVSRCSRQGGQVQEYRDATSVAAYGPIAFDDTGLLFGTDGEALDRATWRVLRYKDPAFRVESITLRPRGNVALWPHVLGRLVGDRVTIQITPLAVGTAILVDCFISGITHRLTDVYTTSSGSSAGDWATVWQLEPVDPNATSWLIVGSGASYNQVGAKVGY